MKPLFLLLLLTLNAAAEPAKTVVLLCYPVDENIKESCDTFVKEMAKCGFKVERVDDFSGEIDLKDPVQTALIKKVQSLPTTVPIFYSSHGNSFGKKHYLDSLKGNIQRSSLGPMDPWTLPPGIEPNTTPAPAADYRYFATDPILKVFHEHPQILSACFSGTTCLTGKPKLNLITSCASDETSDQIDIGPGVRQEPVLHWIGKLYCDKALLSGADTDAPKGELSEKEIGAFLVTKMGGKKTVAAVLFPRGQNSSIEARVAVSRIAQFPPAGTVIRTVDSSRIERDAKTFAEDQKKGKPHIKSRIDASSKMYELTWREGKQSATETLPGYYDADNSAEASAGSFLKARGLKDTPFTIKSLGIVYKVIVEDMSQPCRVGSYEIPQTPKVSGTVRPLVGH